MNVIGMACDCLFSPRTQTKFKLIFSRNAFFVESRLFYMYVLFSSETLFSTEEFELYFWL